MTTRASLARGQGQGPFQGHVRKWVKKLVSTSPRSQSAKLELLKWVATEERADASTTARLRHIKPVAGVAGQQAAEAAPGVPPLAQGPPSSVNLVSDKPEAVNEPKTGAGGPVPASEAGTASDLPTLSQELSQVTDPGQSTDKSNEAAYAMEAQYQSHTMPGSSSSPSLDTQQAAAADYSEETALPRALDSAPPESQPPSTVTPMEL